MCIKKISFIFLKRIIEYFFLVLFNCFKKKRKILLAYDERSAASFSAFETTSSIGPTI